MFCPSCGKKSDGLCVECYLEKNPIRIEDGQLVMCECGKVRIRGQWTYSLEEAIPLLVEEKLQVPPKIEIESLSFLSFELEKSHVNVDIEVNAKYNGESFSKTISKKFKVEKGKCTACGRLAGGYYEMVIQFRLENPIPLLEEIDRDQVSSADRVRGGVDVYLIDASYGKRLVRELMEKGYLISESSSLVGMKEGKEVYRLTAAVKEPAFSEGDFLSYKQGLWEVKKRGRKTKLSQLEGDKSLAIPLKEIKDKEPVAKENQSRKAIITASRPGEVQIMDLDSQKTYEVPTERNLSAGQQVRYVIIDDRVILL